MIAGKITAEDLIKDISTQAYYYNSEQNFNICNESFLASAKLKCAEFVRKACTHLVVSIKLHLCPKTRQTQFQLLQKYPVRYFDTVCYGSEGRRE